MLFVFAFVGSSPITVLRIILYAFVIKIKDEKKWIDRVDAVGGRPDGGSQWIEGNTYVGLTFFSNTCNGIKIILHPASICLIKELKLLSAQQSKHSLSLSL